VAKKLASGTVSRKVLKLEKTVARRAKAPAVAAEARAWIAAHASEIDGLPADTAGGSLSSPERQRVEKKTSDREREKFTRNGVRRRLVKKPKRGVKPNNDDLWAIRALTEHSGAKYWTKILPKHRVMIGALREVLDRASGIEADPREVFDPVADKALIERLLEQKLERERAHAGEARSGALEQVELAYAAAFPWPLEAEWQWRLHLEVGYALDKRAHRRGKEWPGATSGEQILRDVWAHSFAGTVPQGLTASAIEKILNTSTLGAGGGRRGAKNVRVAVNDLIRSLGHEPFDPRPPPGKLDARD
jgi:hypothetical protein